MHCNLLYNNFFCLLCTVDKKYLNTQRTYNMKATYSKLSPSPLITSWMSSRTHHCFRGFWHDSSQGGNGDYDAVDSSTFAKASSPAGVSLSVSRHPHRVLVRSMTAKNVLVTMQHQQQHLQHPARERRRASSFSHIFDPILNPVVSLLAGFFLTRRCVPHLPPPVDIGLLLVSKFVRWMLFSSCIDAKIMHELYIPSLLSYSCLCHPLTITYWCTGRRDLVAITPAWSANDGPSRCRNNINFEWDKKCTDL